IFHQIGLFSIYSAAMLFSVAASMWRVMRPVLVIKPLHLFQPFEHLVIDLLVLAVLDEVIERHAQCRTDLLCRLDGGYGPTTLVLADLDTPLFFVRSPRVITK